MMTFGLVVSWTPASNKIPVEQQNVKKEKYPRPLGGDDGEGRLNKHTTPTVLFSFLTVHGI